MSNEYKDYCHDIRKNFDDATNSLNYLPRGWVNSFVPKLKDELFNMLGQYAEDFCVLQCKEKYGEMRLYWHFPDRDYYTDEDYDYLEKYGDSSSLFEESASKTRYNDKHEEIPEEILEFNKKLNKFKYGVVQDGKVITDLSDFLYNLIYHIKELEAHENIMAEGITYLKEYK